MHSPDKRISVLDYGAANIGSVLRMLDKAGAEPVRATNERDIEEASRLILPGVGAFDHGMQQLSDRNLVDPLHRAAKERRIPILGICLGMQLMCRSSEEGQRQGLGWIDAVVERFNFDPALKLPVPHMGWNTLHAQRPSPLLPDGEGESRYYFVHSYKVRCLQPQDVVATTSYGGSFVSVFNRDNLYGAQFHPEKSHRFGMQLLGAFLQVPHA